MPGKRSKLAAYLTGLVVAGLLAPGWATDGTLRKLPLVELDIRPLQGSSGSAPERLVLQGDRPSSVKFSTDWDGVGRVGVELTARAAAVGSAQAVRLQAELTLPGGRRIQAARESVVDEHGTILFELFRQDEQPFTLAIEATVSETWEVIRTPRIGKAVRFEVEVFRIEGHTKTSLERNILQTFENQTVGYEFRLGPKPMDDALTLKLTPIRVVDSLVEIRINLEGRLGVDGELTVVGRDEILIVNRDRSTPITAVAGEPPSGYEFRLTPRF